MPVAQIIYMCSQGRNQEFLLCFINDANQEKIYVVFPASFQFGCNTHDRDKKIAPF